MGGVGEWKSPGTALDPQQVQIHYICYKGVTIKDVKSKSFNFFKLVNKWPGVQVVPPGLWLWLIGSRQIYNEIGKSRLTITP